MTVMDWRNIDTGWEIPSETYADQPYVVQTDDGAWLCVMTTGGGREGEAGQHIVARRSTDHGRTWSEAIDIEPADGPEASYAVLLKGPQGRVFCFYNHNSDNLREVVADDPPYAGGRCRRVDSLGHYCFRYSDDHGRSRSRARSDIPMRLMDIDRRNPYEGRVCFFWNVGKPFIRDGTAYVSLHKVGGFGQGFFTRSEGVLLRSEDLLTLDDPTPAHWQTLPDGEFGLRTPLGGGAIAEEQSTVVLSDGSLYCIYRTVDGHPATSTSRDGGHTWSASQYLRFADGRLVKHPRAATFVWCCANGRYLYWFHHHGGKGYEDRNPVWLCGGREVAGPTGLTIAWSEPEIALYADDPFVRISYPDLVQDGDDYYVTETQKDVARVHPLDPALLAGLWEQHTLAEVAQQGLVLACTQVPANGCQEAMSLLPALLARDAARADYGTYDLRQGLSLDLWATLTDLLPGQVLIDNRRADGKGLCLQTSERETLEVILNDGRSESRWETDPGAWRCGVLQHVGLLIDGGPKIVAFVVNGKVCDGGEHRQFGWGRYNAALRDVNGAGVARLGQSLHGRLWALRVYDRCLRVSEMVGNWRAGCSGGSGG